MQLIKDFSPDKNAVVAGIIAALCFIKSLGFFWMKNRQSTLTSRMEAYEWVLSGILWASCLILIFEWNGISRWLAILLLVNSLLLAGRREVVLDTDPARLALYLQTILWFCAAIISFRQLRIADGKPVRVEG
jgi:hypothetical protein